MAFLNGKKVNICSDSYDQNGGKPYSAVYANLILAWCYIQIEGRIVKFSILRFL